MSKMDVMKKIQEMRGKINIYLITHNQQVNPIIEIIFYINANKIESVISYFDNCLWNMGIQKNHNLHKIFYTIRLGYVYYFIVVYRDKQIG